MIHLISKKKKKKKKKKKCLEIEVCVIVDWFWGTQHNCKNGGSYKCDGKKENIGKKMIPFNLICSCELHRVEDLYLI